MVDLHLPCSEAASQLCNFTTLKHTVSRGDFGSKLLVISHTPL